MAELNIAIADDNPQTLEVLCDILEGEEGFNVVGQADNGEDAYNMILKTKPDVVLMDIIMPRLDGISVMEKVKNNDSLKKSPSFIMVTAAGSENMTEEAFRMGAYYYIMKPFSRKMIVTKVRQVAEKGRKDRMTCLENKRIKPYTDKYDYMEQNQMCIRDRLRTKLLAQAGKRVIFAEKSDYRMAAAPPCDDCRGKGAGSRLHTKALLFQQSCGPAAGFHLLIRAFRMAPYIYRELV